MLITKEQQEALVQNYNKEGHSFDESIAFTTGMVRTIEMMQQIAKRENYEGNI